MKTRCSVQIRCEQSELERWKRGVAAAGLTLTELVRSGIEERLDALATERGQGPAPGELEHALAELGIELGV